MLKKLIAAVLASAMLLSLSATAFAAESTYKISSAEDLKLLAAHPDGTFELQGDIDMKNAIWTPVGTEAKPFCGTLNGNNHEILNLKISDAAAMGLIAYNSGTIKDLTLYNLSATATGAVLFGGFAGQNSGTIENCVIDVAQAKITTRKDAAIGQIAGINAGTILGTTCALDLEITAKSGARVGGLCGINSGKIKDSDAAGRLIVTGDAAVGLLLAEAKTSSKLEGSCFSGNMAKLGGELLTKMVAASEGKAEMKDCLWRDNSTSPELLSEQEYNQRRKVVDYNNLMASFVWSPSRDIDIDYTDSSNSTGTYSQHFYTGQLYYGMTYGPRGKNIGSMLDGFDENGEFKDYVTDGPNGWDLYNSADCSSLTTNCWQVISPTVRATNTSNFMPGYVSPAFGPSNTIQVGEYVISAKAASSNKTADVYRANFRPVMAEALCQCLPGDAVNSTTKGHVRMVMQTKIMRDKDGKPDLDKTILYCNGMGDGLALYHHDINANAPYTLATLLNTEYIPVSIKEFKEGSPKAKVELKNCSALNRNTICQGEFETNYGILNAKMEITDANGKPVWSHTLWERVYFFTNYGNNSNDMGRRTHTKFDLSRFLTSLAEAKLKIGSKYNVKVTTLLSNLETYEVKNYSFVY